MMIPALLMHALLKDFKSEITSQVLKSTNLKPASTQQTTAYYHAFYELLGEAEDDLSFIHSMIERDPDCRFNDTNMSLSALLDYINITIAIYDAPATQS